MSLIRDIEKIKSSEVKELIASRIKEFESVDKKQAAKEICFCITTANCSAERCIEIQQKLKHKLKKLDAKQMQKELKRLGYRYHNRAPYLVEACKNKELVKAIEEKQEFELREWLAKNIKGLGFKEASHFMRNIGYKDVAIIDFHIIDLLERYNILERPKTMTKARYMEIEQRLREIARKAKLNLAELDLYLWYIETGKVLK